MSKITVRGLAQSLTVTQGPVIIGNSGAITAADITDSSATGRAVLTGDAVAGRGVLEVYSEQETLIKINAKFAEVGPMLIPLQEIQAKASCKVATVGNIDINAPLSAIAGIDLFDNERALVWQQTDELENGTYFLIDGYLSRYGRFYNDDLPTFSTLEIQQGAYTGRRFRVTSETATPGTAPMTWELVGRESLGLGTAAPLNVAASGDATAGQVVKGDDSRLTNDRTASGLRTATTVVAISAATAPSAGQTLVATSSTAATWQTPASGGISAADLAGGTLPASLTTLATSGVATLAGLTLTGTYPALSVYYAPYGGGFDFSNLAFMSKYGLNLNKDSAITFSATVYHGVDRDLEIARNGVNRMGIGSYGVWNDAALELGAVRKKAYTVGTLPVAPSAYDQCLVVDALAPAIGSAVVGGGSVAVNVIWISPNWVVI